MRCIQALDPSDRTMILLHALAVCSVGYKADLQSLRIARPGSCGAGPAAFDREVDDQAVVSAPTTMRESLA